MQILEIWNNYTRKEVHSIFSPETKFTPRAGTWGLQGIVRVPARSGDWVFFVTFGQEQGSHVFDESITEEGVLSWQSQPAQQFTDPAIQEFIQHDASINNIHLFLRTNKKASYSYLGTLGYITHDSTREEPVHFQWQLLQWPAPIEFLNRIGLRLFPSEQEANVPLRPGLTIKPPPPPKPKRQGVIADTFRRNKSPDYATQDALNRTLGLQGEQLVIAHEKETLTAAGRHDLAEKVVHVSIVEGDGAGYDIRSFLTDGSIRYIEVKTTQGNAYTSFYISPNEIAFSEKNPVTYYLYRLYEFDTKKNSAHMYVLRGDVNTYLDLSPMAYRANLRNSAG
ncbi:DUF3427 domain-containing protein [Advenella kashmirensis]